MIRVLLVDDQALMRAGFTMIIDAEDDMQVIGEAADGREAIDLVRSLRPDVVLMDVRMPKMDGLAATAAISESGGEDAVPVLVLTTFDADEHIYGALRAGARGFLLKDTPPDDLLEAIRVCAAGDAMLAPAITRRLIEEFAHRPQVEEPTGVAATLTAREHEVLVAMARGQSNREIAESLVVSDATVKTHVGKVLQKLGVRDRVQAVIYAYEHGLIVPGEEPSP